MKMVNPSVEGFNEQIRETIRLLETEERLLKRRRVIEESDSEERILDDVRRYV
jgi:hypothetical protein